MCLGVSNPPRVGQAKPADFDRKPEQKINPAVKQSVFA
jgi:hypothetical protein